MRVPVVPRGPCRGLEYQRGLLFTQEGFSLIAQLRACHAKSGKPRNDTLRKISSLCVSGGARTALGRRPGTNWPHYAPFRKCAAMCPPRTTRARDKKRRRARSAPERGCAGNRAREGAGSEARRGSARDLQRLRRRFSAPPVPRRTSTQLSCPAVWCWAALPPRAPRGGDEEASVTWRPSRVVGPSGWCVVRVLSSPSPSESSLLWLDRLCNARYVFVYHVDGRLRCVSRRSMAGTTPGALADQTPDA